MVVIFDHLVFHVVDQNIEEERKAQVDQHAGHEPEERVLIQILFINLLEAQIEEVDDV